MRKAILCAVKLDNYQGNFENVIKECENLCLACDIEVVDTLIQNAKKLDSKTAFGSGKVEELKKLVNEKEAQLVVFYNNLSFATLNRIEKIVEVETIDRTTVILDIFALRATSRAAKIQTEIARLKYNLPKLLNVEVAYDRSRGGDVISRGSGESKAKIIKRKIEHDLAMLKNELKDYETHNTIQAKKRNKSGIKKVALVGYTNAGKSSLMNTILTNENKEEKAVLAKDLLFATLDATVRKIKHKNTTFYLFDTVGFVSDLPHDLIDAFKTTLAAAKEADLLIHVIDCSNQLYLEQMDITLNCLKQIQADQIPIINVYNKADLINICDKKTDELYISTLENTNIDKLLDLVVEKINPTDEIIKCLIPYDKYYLLDKYQHLININIIENSDVGTLIELKTNSEILEIFKNYQI